MNRKHSCRIEYRIMSGGVIMNVGIIMNVEMTAETTAGTTAEMTAGTTAEIPIVTIRCRTL